MQIFHKLSNGDYLGFKDFFEYLGYLLIYPFAFIFGLGITYLIVRFGYWFLTTSLDILNNTPIQ